MPRRAEDLTGKTYNDLTCETYLGHRVWRCRCVCGETRDVVTHQLKDDVIKRCVTCQAKLRGGRSVERQPVDITGEVFSDLTVVKYLGNRVWLTQCVCGNTREVDGANLRNGVVKRCKTCVSEIRSLTGQTIYARRKPQPATAE